MCVGRFDLRHFRARLRQNFVHAEGKSECVASLAGGSGNNEVQACTKVHGSGCAL